MVIYVFFFMENNFLNKKITNLVALSDPLVWYIYVKILHCILPRNVQILLVHQVFKNINKINPLPSKTKMLLRLEFQI